MRFHLRYHQAYREDVGTDVIRILDQDRGGLPARAIYSLSIGSKRRLVELRGNKNPPRRRRELESGSYVLIDDAVRDKLGMDEAPGTWIDLDLVPATQAEEQDWLLQRSDPATRIAAKANRRNEGMTRWGTVVGVTGVFLAIAGLAIAFKPELATQFMSWLRSLGMPV